MNDTVQILMAAVGALGFSIIFQIRGKKLWLCALGGGLSWMLYLLLEPVFPSEFTRYFFSALFVAVYAELLARELKTPATTFLMPCIIPHVPGGALYHTMCFALEKQWSQCFHQAFYTLKLALGLALGIAVVISVLSAQKAVIRKKVSGK